MVLRVRVPSSAALFGGGGTPGGTPLGLTVTATIGTPTGAAIPEGTPLGLEVTATLGQSTGAAIPEGTPLGLTVTPTLGTPTGAAIPEATPVGISVIATLGTPTGDGGAVSTTTLFEIVRDDLYAAFRSAAVALQAGIADATWASTTLPYVTYGQRQQMGHENMGRRPHVSFWFDSDDLESLRADGGAYNITVGIRVSVKERDEGEAQQTAKRIIHACVKAARADPGEVEGDTRFLGADFGPIGFAVVAEFDCVRTYQFDQQGIIVT